MTNRPSDGRTVTINGPCGLDARRVKERPRKFHPAYGERVATAGGQIWRYRQMGASDHPLIMIPGIQGGGSVFFDVALEFAGKLVILTLTAPPIVDADASADSQTFFQTAIGIECAVTSLLAPGGLASI